MEPNQKYLDLEIVMRKYKKQLEKKVCYIQKTWLTLDTPIHSSSWSWVVQSHPEIIIEKSVCNNVPFKD